MILSNQVECLRCNDQPWSGGRHDFRYCKCGAVAVDGGQDYLKRTGAREDWKDMSIVVSDAEYKLLLNAITDETRNDLGHVCNLARVLRDEFRLNIGEA